MASRATSWSGMRVGHAEGLFGVPGVADLAVGVAGCEQAAQLGVAAFGDAFVCLEQQPPYPIQRVVFGAASAGGLVLDASAHLVDGAVGELDDMERVGDLDRFGQRVGERLAVRA